MKKKQNKNLFEKKELVAYAWRTNNPITTIRHMISIANILFEEILKDLEEGKQIKIKNFGTLVLQNDKRGAIYFDETLGKNIRKVQKYLKFRFERKINLILTKTLDIDSLGKNEQIKKNQPENT